jgi:hypothetical protein
MYNSLREACKCAGSFVAQYLFDVSLLATALSKVDFYSLTLLSCCGTTSRLVVVNPLLRTGRGMIARDSICDDMHVATLLRL